MDNRKRAAAQDESSQKRPRVEDVQAEIERKKLEIQRRFAAMTAGQNGSQSTPSAGTGSTTGSSMPSTNDIRRQIEEKAREARARLAQMQAGTATPVTSSSYTPPVPHIPTQEVKATGGLSVGIHPLIASLMAKDDKSSKVDTKKLLIPKAGFATVKANQRLAGAPTAAPVIPHGQSKKQLPIVKPEIIKDNPYFDHTIGVPVKAKKKQNLKFVRHGKFVQKAEQLRAHAKMEELKKKIAETVKKAGMDNLDLVSDKAVQREPPPLIEWWDSALLYHNKSYDELPTDDTFLLFSEAVPVSEDSKESLPPVTHYVLHPIPIQPPFHTGPPPPRPLMLTAKERKKIRRQRRAEELKEKQDKQRLGLIPPDPPKVKMSNLMRVLANEAIQDPTKIEAMVREQVEKRQHEHHAANQARKLTEEQKKEKKKKKLEEDTSAMVDVAIYKVKDLSHPKIKFKVDTNAQQLNLTGVAVVNPTCNIVIVEGGPKGLKKYKKLMLRRIDWSETSGLEPKEEKDESNDDNGAYLIWEGQVRKRAFHGFRFKACPLEKMVVELLSRARVEHYWELAKNWKASEVEQLVGPTGL